jgi:hypothetical protein
VIRTAIIAALSFGLAAPAFAQAPTYRLVPVTAVTKAGSVILGDTLWACGAAGCSTGKATARPAIVCELAAKKVGKLASFTVNETAFDEAALAKCNAKARA